MDTALFIGTIIGLAVGYGILGTIREMDNRIARRFWLWIYWIIATPIILAVGIVVYNEFSDLSDVKQAMILGTVLLLYIGWHTEKRFETFQEKIDSLEDRLSGRN